MTESPAQVAGTSGGPTGLIRRHKWFAMALGLGVLVRLLVFAGFRNGLMVSDAYTYLKVAEDPVPIPERVIGYSLFLAPFVQSHVPTWYVAGVQHLLGLGVATLAYVLLRRWGVGPRAATLAVLPVLLDALQLMLEQAMMSEVFYEVTLIGGIAALAWRRIPAVHTAALGGFLLALSVLVRVGGGPVILGGIAFCLLAATSWRARVVTSAVVTVAFVVPLVGYATWFHVERGPYALTTSSGRSLYMRTTTFVDCSKFYVPAYEKRLCPRQPLGHRLDPNHYGWHNPDLTAGLRPPRGISLDQAFQDFARRAIRAQPTDYLRTVGRDTLLPLGLVRGDRYEYNTSRKWQISTYLDHPPTASALAFYRHHGGAYRVWRPAATLMADYGRYVYLWGPLLAVLLLVAVAGLLWPRRPRSTRPLIVLTLLLGVGLTLVPVLTNEFGWRYILPAIMLVPMSAACAWTRVRLPNAASAHLQGSRARPTISGSAPPRAEPTPSRSFDS